MGKSRRSPLVVILYRQDAVEDLRIGLQPDAVGKAQGGCQPVIQDGQVVLELGSGEFEMGEKQFVTANIVPNDDSLFFLFGVWQGRCSRAFRATLIPSAASSTPGRCERSDLLFWSASENISSMDSTCRIPSWAYAPIEHNDAYDDIMNKANLFIRCYL